MPSGMDGAVVIAQPSVKVKVIGDDDKKMGVLREAAGVHLLPPSKHRNFRLNTEALRIIKASSANNKQLVLDALRRAEASLSAASAP